MADLSNMASSDPISAADQGATIRAYRAQATFDVGAMRSFLEGEDILAYMKQIYDTLRDDPVFQQPDKELSREEYQALTLKRVRRLLHYRFLSDSQILDNPLKSSAFSVCIGSFDWSLFARYSLNAQVCEQVLIVLRMIQFTLCFCPFLFGHIFEKPRLPTHFPQQKR